MDSVHQGRHKHFSKNFTPGKSSKCFSVALICRLENKFQMTYNKKLRSLFTEIGEKC